MRSFNLFPVNTLIPTHFSKSSSTLLDLFFVSHPEKVLNFDQLSASCFSLHDLIYITFDVLPNCSQPVYRYRDFRNVNSSLLESELKKIEWFRVYGMLSTDEQISFLSNNILKLFNDFIPLKSKILKKNDSSWFNNNIMKLY